MPLVIGTSLDVHTGPHFEIFQKAGFQCREVSRELNLRQPGSLIEAVRDAEAIIAGSEPYTRQVIESLPQLRVIARSGVGYDAVDLAACDDAGVAVAVTPGVNHHAVAEHTMALLFGLARGFPENDQRVRTGKWKRPLGPRVMGSTLGIVGLGRIGQAVATRAVGVGLKVLVYEPTPNREFVEQWKLELVSLDELLANADYVSLHLPAIAATRRLINAQTLKQMKPGSVLINTARGALVDQQALIAALQSGHLRAAGLDVFEVEPLPVDSPLIGMSNVLLSVHSAGLDLQSRDDTFAMCADTIISLSRGGWPTDRIVNLGGVADWRWTR